MILALQLSDRSCAVSVGDERPTGIFPSGVFLFSRSARLKLDRNDIVYYAGLTMLFVGLALSVSVETALVVVGASLAAVALVNSYVRILLSR
jgi:hypothetical protein